VRCAIYTRVSTEEQAKEGYSLAAQEERLRAHAKNQGWAVYKLYVDDGYSAGSRNRPALKRLLADAALKRFDVVLAYKIDRLSRSLKDLIDIVAELNQFDVGFKSCTELIDTTRPEGRLMFHQFGSFAQYERELIGQRTRFGMMKRLRQGLWNGIPPYGYRIVEGKLVVEPQEAEWVQKIFRWYLQQNLGVVAISRELNRLGVHPRRGDRWKGTRIYKLITNPLYAGFVRWGGEMAQGTHEPIIEQERFDAVQRTLHQRNHRSRQLRSPNCLSGLVRCGLCGAPMHVTYPGIEPKSRFKYYVCNNRYNHHSCKQEYIRADILEASVIREIGKLAERREMVAELVREFTDHNRGVRLPELEARRQAVLAELEGVRCEREKLSRWLSGAGLTAQAIGFVNNQVDRLSEQEGQVQERLWALEDEIAALQTVTYNAQEICDQLTEFVRAFPTLSDGERRLVVDSLIREVALKHKEVAVCLTPPLAGLGFVSTELAPRGIGPLFRD
jgi:site-specific DNA recombinase